MSILNCHRCGLDSVRSIVFLSVVLASVGPLCGLAAGQAVPPGPTGAPAGAAAAAATAAKGDRRIEPEKSLENQGREVTRMLMAGSFEPGQQEVFDRYYTRFVFAQWSLPENRAELWRFRGNLRSNLRTAGTGSRPPQVHDYLNSLALKALEFLARPHPGEDEFHPATRVNAMLMIGELNAAEAGRASTLPTPLAEALPVLVRTVGDANQLDAVKVEALVGIIRHAKLGGIQTQDRSTVSNAMLAVATSTLAAGAAPDAGHAWMRAQVAEVLGLLGDASSQVTTALGNMVSDRTLPFSARCAAAEALGKLNYRGVTGLNPSTLAAALGELAADACAAEEKAAKISRRRLKSRLKTASVGLTGPDGNSGLARLATGPPHAAFVAALKTALTAMLGHVDDPGTADDKTMLENVKQEVPKLNAAPTNTPGP